MIKRKIDPFKAAISETEIHVALKMRDVKQLRPQWSDAQARAFLEQHAAVVAEVMLIAGIGAMNQLLENDHHVC